MKENTRNHVNTEEIVYPDECCKCRSKNVLVSDFIDAYIIWLTIYCQDCHNKWREKIDLTI